MAVSHQRVRANGALRRLAGGLLLAALRAAAECSGYDEEWGLCPDLQPCQQCSPVDCAFTSWGDWYEGGGCTGLVFRQRMVKTANNECGLPCDGPKIESKAHVLDTCMLKPQDCKLSAWTAWSKCASATDQSYRTREALSQPLNGGEPCMGETQETQPCAGPTPVDCELADWSEWTDCSATCGEGRHSRTRKVIMDAEHNGQACSGTILETQACMAPEPCPVKDCTLSAWSDWSVCDGERHLQRYRLRQVLTPAVGLGKQCQDALKETNGCPAPEPVDCALSSWSPWAGCDRACGGGQTFRTRYLKEPMRNNGTCAPGSLRETAPCNTDLCAAPPGDCEVGEWAEWSDCSAKCGRGSMTRKRKVKNNADEGGQGCTESLEEISPCESVSCNVTDCAWSNWYDWSACTTSCGGGSKRRSRVVAAAPRNGGALCEALTKSEAVPCNTEPCSPDCVDGKWGAWLEWSSCTASCSSGFRTRRRDIAQDPNECGRAVAGVREEYAACSDLPPCVPDTDCALSDWQEWSYCTNACFGVRERNRAIQVFATGNGKACEADSLKEVEPCNPGPGSQAPLSCQKPKQDAMLTDWSDWGDCSRSCGGGQKVKSRRLLTEPKHGGMVIAESLSMTAPCNTEKCGPVEPCVDCQWGEWGEWGDCTKCGGQRWRHRSIEQMPNSCGKLCDIRSAKEVSNCTGNCQDTLFCAWTKWSEPSGCGTGCGAGTTLRNRALGLTRSAKEHLFIGSGSTPCSGTQLYVQQCSDAKPCKEECQPRHGELGAWSEWTKPTCLGLCERERSVAVVNNECGMPAEGPLVETKRCEATCDISLPCKLSQWAEWSKCTDPNGQRFRNRAIEQMPVQDGAPCTGALNETSSCSQPCHTQPCKLSDWGEWSTCARTCGGGWQTRNRRVTEPAKCGGALCDETLEELQMCNAEACEAPKTDCVLAAWSSWSGCGPDGQRYRERSVEAWADGGSPCTGGLQETETCGVTPVDCSISEWTEWDECEKTCGGGQQHRHRQIHRYAAKGGLDCPAELMQTRGCAAAPCSAKDCELSDWSSWETCSTSCGAGQKKRMRMVLHSRSAGGLGCRAALSQAVPCQENLACPKQDCEWNEWTEWSSCSCSCGGGQRTRDRSIKKSPRGGGEPCQLRDREEVAPCNTHACKDPKCVDGAWSEWSEWSPCSKSCGGGVTFRTRKVATSASECGAPASGNDRETAFCSVDESCEAAVDCTFTDWGGWSACSATCSGTKRRSRRISRYGRGNGAFCVGGLKETSPCNPTPDGTPPAECAQAPAVHCLLGEWSEWGACSATCGGGRSSRSREVLQEAEHGGKACEGSLSEARECGRDLCGHEPVDCAFGDWQDWGACAKCGGQRKRFRSITQYPKFGGANCVPFAHEETSSCPRKCGEEAFCTWAAWKSWGQCNAQCGEGRRSRRRYLAVTDDAAAPSPKLLDAYDASGLAAELVELQRQRVSLQANYTQSLVLAFAGGCLSFVAALFVVRGATASGSRLRRTSRAEAARSPGRLPAPADHRHNMGEAAEPLVEMAADGLE